MNFIPGKIVQVLPDNGGAWVQTDADEKLLCQMPGTAVKALGGKVFASIRPEDVEVFFERPTDRENLFEGTLVHKAYLGNFLFFFVSMKGTMIRAQVPHHLLQKEEQSLFVYLNPEKSLILS